MMALLLLTVVGARYRYRNNLKAEPLMDANNRNILFFIRSFA